MDVRVSCFGLLFLDRLRVPGCQADKDEDADYRDGELESGRPEEQMTTLAKPPIPRSFV
jgi:hypothetical protein